MATQSDKHKGKASRCSARAACWSRASWSEVIDKLEKNYKAPTLSEDTDMARKQGIWPSLLNTPRPFVPGTWMASRSTMGMLLPVIKESKFQMSQGTSQRCPWLEHLSLCHGTMWPHVTALVPWFHCWYWWLFMKIFVNIHQARQGLFLRSILPKVRQWCSRFVFILHKHLFKGATDLWRRPKGLNIATSPSVHG